MGRSKADKEASRDRILQVAAARFRELGIDGLGLVPLMNEAGLTHGGFYRHFASRDDLIAEGVQRALDSGAAGILQAVEQSTLAPPVLLIAVVDWYLSVAHRDGLATSCAVTSLAADVARSNERARTAYTAQVGRYVDLFVLLMAGPRPKKAKRAKAVAAWSMLVGALSLARAVNDDALSTEILQTAATELRKLLA